MAERMKLIALVVFYLAGGGVLYLLTREQGILFLVYKIGWSVLFFVLLWRIYQYLAKKEE